MTSLIWLLTICALFAAAVLLAWLTGDGDHPDVVACRRFGRFRAGLARATDAAWRWVL